MALYNGFFDAVVDKTGKYDRTYNSGDFTHYFSNTIGSGVCIHNAPDSFRVRLENGKAVVSPGYLFIQGYWCKNDADYAIELPGTGNYAIVAHLNLGKRMIELEAHSVAQAYPDSLVLAIVSPTSAEDTRYNTDICGIIDTAGELSNKVEWAINYIDNEIESKLAAAEADINAQSEKLDRKIAEVQAQVDRITPPPVGSIKFSASQDVDADWLKCDGSFVNEADYPELVAALGKLTPSGDKFQLLSDGEIGPQISNGAICAGRLWVYSYSAKKLYGVDIEGTQAIKEISLSGDENFSNWIAPSANRPIALSIIPSLSTTGTYKLFLAQFVGNGFNIYYDKVEAQINNALGPTKLLLYCADFSGNEETISMERPFQSITEGTTVGYGNYVYGAVGVAIPYVTSRLEAGAETFYCIPCGGGSGTLPQSTSRYAGYLSWAPKNGSDALFNAFAYAFTRANSSLDLEKQIIAFNKKNKNELLYILQSVSNSGGVYYNEATIRSIPVGYFNRDSASYLPSAFTPVANVPTNTLYGGNDFVVLNAAADVTKEAITPRGSLSGLSVVNFSNLSMPSAKRIFLDAGAYLWGKSIYMLFVGTGLIFSRSLTEGSFGYLDTTSVLGTITQFGYLDYSQDEGTLYLLGQDTSNRVKVAKIVLNTLYDYANDGAWLPMIASDGVPAYIKARGDADAGGKVSMTIKVLAPNDSDFNLYADLLFNGESLIAGTYTREVDANGTFTAGLRVREYHNFRFFATMNGTTIASLTGEAGTQTVTFNVSDFISGGITLQGGIGG